MPPEATALKRTLLKTRTGSKGAIIEMARVSLQLVTLILPDKDRGNVIILYHVHINNMLYSIPSVYRDNVI